MKKILVVLLIGFLSGVGVFFYIQSQKTPEVFTVHSPDESNILSRLRTYETLPISFKGSKELITFEVELEEKIAIDDSWLDFGIFRKSQEMTFYGTGLYTVDLALVESENIHVSPEGRRISIYVDKPAIKAVHINEEKTLYYYPDSGLFRTDSFIKLTSPEQQAIMGSIKDTMAAKMRTQELMGQAENETKKSLEELYGEFTKAVFGDYYGVEIIWK